MPVRQPHRLDIDPDDATLKDLAHGEDAHGSTD
jgi:hypothetical protein